MITLTPELTGWTMPNATSVVSPDGETEIGDVLQATFFPQFKKKKWNNESNFSMRLSLADYANPNVLQTEGDTIVWTKGQYSCRMRLGANGFEFEIVLGTAPLINYLDFTLSLKDVELWLQPPLTAEQIATGRNRPDNVVNSIAVYHTTKNGNAYQTGKVGHLYRPQATDALNNTAWGDWSITGPTTVRMTIPAPFLASATYPVRIR